MNIEDFVAEYPDRVKQFGSDCITIYSTSGGTSLATVKYDPDVCRKILDLYGIKPTDPFVRLLKKHGFDPVAQKRLRPGGYHTEGDAQLHVYRANTDSYTIRAVLNGDDVPVATKLSLARLDRVLTELYS